MANLNPMGITSGVWQGNAQQSDYRVPGMNAKVASYAVGANILNVPAPVPLFVEKLSNSDDPQGSIRAGRSGH